MRFAELITESLVEAIRAQSLATTAIAEAYGRNATWLEIAKLSTAFAEAEQTTGRELDKLRAAIATELSLKKSNR